MGREQAALQLRQQTLEIRKRVLDDEHPDTLQAMNNIASSYLTLGRYQEALELDKKALEVRKRVLGDEHSDTF